MQRSFISHFLARSSAQCKSSAGCHKQFTFCLSWSCYFISKLCHITVCLLFRTFRIAWYCTGGREGENGWENKKPSSCLWYMVIYYYRVVTVTTVIMTTYLSVIKIGEINPIPTFYSYCFQGLSLRKLSKNKGIFSQIDPCDLRTYQILQDTDIYFWDMAYFYKNYVDSKYIIFMYTYSLWMLCNHLEHWEHFSTWLKHCFTHLYVSF